MEEKIKRSTGKVLTTVRTERGLSQEKLANMCNVDRSYISRIERGMQSPSVVNLFKICEVLDISPEDFVSKID